MDRKLSLSQNSFEALQSYWQPQMEEKNATAMGKLAFLGEKTRHLEHVSVETKCENVYSVYLHYAVIVVPQVSKSQPKGLRSAWKLLVRHSKAGNQEVG